MTIRVHSSKMTTLLLLLAAGLLTGCSGSDGIEEGMPAPAVVSDTPKEISVSPASMQYTRAATIDDDEDLQGRDLLIYAYFNGTETAFLNGVKQHYDSDAWCFWSSDAATHYYWPIAGSEYQGVTPGITVSSLDFVGYCPYSRPAYVTAPTYSYADGITFTADMTDYMTSDAQASMTEFMYGYLANQTYATQTSAGGALPLTFQHPFAKIYFTLSSASGTAVTVNSITLGGVKTTGTYNSTQGWSLQDGSATLTIATTGDTPYIVIPYDYGYQTLTVNATWKEWGSEVTTDVSASVDFDWTAGYSYTYNLTLSKYALVVETTKYTEQW